MAEEDQDQVVVTGFVQNSNIGEPTSTTSNSVTIQLENDDIAFVLGKRGHTKSKLARVSGARLDIDEVNMRLTIEGDEVVRGRALEYIDMVLGQRKGAVKVDTSHKRDDLTVLHVPEDCVGYVTGKAGTALRNLEEEWGTLMFFANSQTDAEGNPLAHGSSSKVQSETGETTETLVIFGPRKGRVGASLKVMSSVEHKKPGYFVQDERFVGDLSADLEDPEGFYLDQQILQEIDFRYALGEKGNTRKKLAKASGCILEYVGLAAVMVGSKQERSRASDYLGWLLLQRKAGNIAVDVNGRDDVRVLELESKYVGWVTGAKGKNLRGIERDTGVFLFANSIEHADGEKDERIMIFSHDEQAREKAYNILVQRIEDKKRADAGGFVARRYDDDQRGAGDRFRRRSPPQRRRSPQRRRHDSPPPLRGRRDEPPQRRSPPRGGARRVDDRGAYRYDERRSGGNSYDERRIGDDRRDDRNYHERDYNYRGRSRERRS